MVQMSANFLANGSFEPQRQQNWTFQVTIPGSAASQTYLSSAVESSNLPQLTIEEIPLHWMNEIRYVAGKATYETIPLRLKDMVNVGIAKAVYDWQRRVYDPETGNISFADKYKLESSLILYAPDMSTERVWNLYGCWPRGFNPGALDMSSNEKVLLDVTIRYDRAVPQF